MLKIDAALHVASEDSIENGVWVTVLTKNGDPVTHPKKPTKELRYRVRSKRSAIYRNETLHTTVKAQTLFSRTKIRDQEKVVLETSQRGAEREFSLLLMELDGFDIDQPDRVQVLTREDAMTIYQRSDMQWFVDQVLDAAKDDDLFGFIPDDPKKGAAEEIATSAPQPEPKSED